MPNARSFFSKAKNRLYQRNWADDKITNKRLCYKDSHEDVKRIINLTPITIMNNFSKSDVEAWVGVLHSECEATITNLERKEQQKYATMIASPKDKIFLSKMLDESSQIRNDAKLAKRIKVLIDTYGVPKFFNSTDAALLKMYQFGGYVFTWPAVDIIKKRVRTDTAGVIINEARPLLTNHLESRYKSGIGQNVNLLGEVVLGNNEADHRYHHYLEALKEPDINYISVKLSGIYAQMHPLNFVQARKELIHRMSTLYQAAIDNPYIASDGSRSPKFVNLDMEEYKDAHLTLEIFKETLSLPQFKNYTAGIVIQAYLCDSEELQAELLNFAHERANLGGAPLKMRLVKGANLQMESVISSLRGWPNPVRRSKVDVDANYLHLLDIAMIPENAEVLHVGVASHNLYTIGYAKMLSEANGVEEYVTFEMLEGMANHLWRAMKKLGKQVILYTPVVGDKHFLNAVSYLVRRLDENTGVENFLSYSFNLKPDTKEWEFLKKQFEQAFEMKDSVLNERVRTQDRNRHYVDVFPNVFFNEPDTDFDLLPNKRWAEKIVDKWKNVETFEIPLQIGGRDVATDKSYAFYDRCQDDVIVCRMGQANEDQVREILNIAKDDAGGWRSTTGEHRKDVLMRVANHLGRMRGELIGCMCAITGKTITEGDVEVSEAIDFCRFYPLSYLEFEKLQSVKIRPKGTVLVISPWNFPLAIPVGGVASALSGGNTVILKPATVAAPIAWMFAQAFWDAGVPKEALQVVITDSREGLNILTKSDVINHIILTGGTDTAQRIQSANPRVALSAETGGKNAIILTESGDRDKAIMNAVASAFGNAGQKCSACSLFLVEKGTYNDPAFKEKLIDATVSLQTGSVWDLKNVIGPMIDDNNEKLLYALEHMENDEEWLVAPQWVDKYTLKPTVKWGVKPGAYSFKTELFAPMLSVVEIDSIEDGIELVNSLDYGLTSGLQSLDEQEIELWKNSVEAGNLYINRGITGAIVNRQPFGGMKLSAFGGGIKAGGVNYVSCFCNFENVAARDNFNEIYSAEFAKPRDVNNLFGEQNVFRYLPLKSMVLRVLEGDTLEDIKLITKAAIVAKTKLVISVDAGCAMTDSLSTLGCDVLVEDMSQFLRSLDAYDRIRVTRSDAPIEIFKTAAVLCKYVACAKPVKEGRVELLHYLKEQSVTFEYHRYGSITEVPKP